MLLPQRGGRQIARYRIIATNDGLRLWGDDWRRSAKIANVGTAKDGKMLMEAFRRRFKEVQVKPRT
jgi:hypothetical protein